jgi:hypothetical protein
MAPLRSRDAPGWVPRPIPAADDRSSHPAHHPAAVSLSAPSRDPRHAGRDRVPHCGRYRAADHPVPQPGEVRYGGATNLTIPAKPLPDPSVRGP